ncbi:MAG: 16S rRNA (cytosine(967)-C(5))-methyltransferase RsmB, partial [Gammaproteobacteria bacterium]|nr:16S rRNA (cytosine(967)-C(5))-methyltransferase RsmB [Gammaproteobacteria bacterium]
EAEFPQWINERVRRDYPDRADAITVANLSRAPLIVRINLKRTSASEYQASLAAAGIGYQVVFRPEHLVLDEAMPAESLPGFDAGLVAIQDAGAGFAATILEAGPGARVLDACAAPGGKLFHLMERREDIQALALDKSADRLQHLQLEAARLGHRPETLTGDAGDLDWWDTTEFDAILVDAPCSGSGTLRRHPDIKLLRKPADLGDYAGLQLRLLTNLWRTLRPGGSLLYCTCSLFTEENDAIVADFLAATDDAGVKDISLPTGIPRKFGWQLLPTDRNTDGFYFSLLNKLVSH